MDAAGSHAQQEAARRNARRQPTVVLKAVPPPYFCFTVPRFQLVPAAEALLGLLFANLFWVGMWDLLDATIFPADSSWAMLLLVVVGTIGMYFTDSLYDVLPDPNTTGAALSTPSGYGTTGDDGALKPPEAQTVSDGGAAAPQRVATPVGWDAPEKKGYEVRDAPFVPPRFEFWRLMERVIANTAAVCIWVGIWDSIDVNFLPVQCSYNACGRCVKYGQFPCAWYKVLFTIVGLVGQYFTRGLYSDTEVSYAPRRACCPCCGESLAVPGAATGPQMA